MSTSDYLIDSALVLLVLLQLKEQPVTRRLLLRPFIFLGIALATYLTAVPTAGNDLPLVAVFALVGGTIGVASGLTTIMRRRDDGVVTTRTGWASAALWVLGMGSRFAFVLWLTHSGAGDIRTFSADHAITSAEAWTVGLLAMAVAEVTGRTLVMALRSRGLAAGGAAPIAA